MTKMTEFGGIKLDVSATEPFLSAAELDAMAPAVNAAAAELENGTCPGSEYLGWLDLPDSITEDDFQAFEASATRAQEDSQVYVVIGIGGSYLGSRAVLDALRGMETDSRTGYPEIIFAGTGLCSSTLNRVLSKCTGSNFRICVISKSGTTLAESVLFNMEQGSYISDHDRKIGMELAKILAGGVVPPGTTVSEQDMLDLERESFMRLLGERKTLERMEHILKTGKPLRN